MKNYPHLPTLFLTIALLVSATFIMAEEKFTLEFRPANNIDSTYMEAINKMVQECFLNNGNFKLSNGADITGESIKSSKATKKADFFLIVKIRTVKMVKIKAASFNYYSKETTFSDCYIFELDFDLELADISKTISLFKKSFEYTNAGPYEPGVVAISPEKAIAKTTNLLMASIFSWINSEIASRDLILARVAESKFNQDLAIRD